MKKGRSLGPAEVDHRKSLSLLRATLESTADGVLVVDNLGKITTYNQQASGPGCLRKARTTGR